MNGALYELIPPERGESSENPSHPAVVVDLIACFAGEIV